MRDFKGKVAVVTGGGGTGIGNALVVELARAGAQVAFCDIAHLDKTERDIAGFDAPHFAATVDMAERSQIDAFIAEVIARFGHIDLLVNNAGIALGDRVFDELGDALQQVDEALRAGIDHAGLLQQRHLARRVGKRMPCTHERTREPAARVGAGFGREP